MAYRRVFRTVPKPLTFWRWKRATSLDQLRGLAAAVEAGGSPALGSDAKPEPGLLDEHRIW